MITTTGTGRTVITAGTMILGIVGILGIMTVGTGHIATTAGITIPGIMIRGITALTIIITIMAIMVITITAMAGMMTTGMAGAVTTGATPGLHTLATGTITLPHEAGQTVLPV